MQARARALRRRCPESRVSSRRPLSGQKDRLKVPNRLQDLNSYPIAAMVGRQEGRTAFNWPASTVLGPAPPVLWAPGFRGCRVMPKKWSGMRMAADALAAQEHLARPEFSSTIARRTVGRGRCDREAFVPRVALPPAFHTTRIQGNAASLSAGGPGPVPVYEGRINVLQAALARRYGSEEIGVFRQSTGPAESPQQRRLEMWEARAGRR